MRMQAQAKVLPLALLSLLMLALLFQQATSQLMLNRTNYTIDSEVIFTVNTSNMSSPQLRITYEGGLYKRAGHYEGELNFNPIETGNYTATLLDKADPNNTHNVNFTVTLPEYLEPLDTVANWTSINLSTANSTYSLGEVVLIESNKPVTTDLVLQLGTPESSLRYMGDLNFPITYTPTAPGDYAATLYDKVGTEVASTAFTILPDQEATAVTVSERPTAVAPPPARPTRKKVKNNGLIAVRNSKAELLHAAIKFKERGELVTLSTHQSTSRRSGRYDVEIQPARQIIKRLTLQQLEMDEDLELGLDDVPTTNVQEVGKNVVRSFAINLENVDFTIGSAVSTARGTELYKCQAWHFESQSCRGSWVKVQDLVPGQEYTIDLFPGDPGYAETGLASVNTDRSRYHPGQVANITIVVLDTAGNLVAGAMVELLITTPNGSTTLLTSYDAVEPEERGIYRVNFSDTELAGNYSMQVRAVGEDVDSFMLSNFVVESSFPFHIIRNIPDTTDPWLGPVHAEIHVLPLGNATTFNFTESLPLNFTLLNTSGATEQLTATRRLLIWENVSSSAPLTYTVQPPFITPELYHFGPAVVEYGNTSFIEARPWFLAVDPQLDATENVDVDIAILDVKTFAVAYLDITSDDASIQVLETDGTVVLAETDVNTDVNLDGRVAVTTINSTHFAVNVYDSSGNNNEFYVYDSVGTQVVGRTEFDANSGTNVDTAVGELGNRLVFAWTDDNGGDDLHIEIWDNDGGQILGETNVDISISAAATLQDLVEVAAINATRWIAAWFDDASNLINLSAHDEAGNLILDTIIDANVGETGQVAVAPLRNELYSLVYYDSNSDEIAIFIGNISDDAHTTVAGPLIIDESPGTASRVDIAEVDINSTSYFVATWWDQADDLFEAAVYNSTGGEITAPFTLDANPDGTYRLHSVASSNSLLGTSLCDGHFIFSYTNNTNQARYDLYNIYGGAWDGACPADVTPPVVTLNSPVNNSNFTTSNVTLSWTATDAVATMMSCDLIVNNVIRTTVTAQNNTLTSATVKVPDGTFDWSVDCRDVLFNAGSSATRSLSVDVPSGFVDDDPAYDVALAPLDISTFVFAWIDSGGNHSSFQVWDTNGTLLVAEIDLDTSGDDESRIDVHPINSTHFVLAIVDGPSDDVDFWIYDRAGTEVQGRTEVSANVADTSLVAASDIGICQLGDRFAVAYVKTDGAGSDDDAEFQIWNNSGTNLVTETAVDGDAGATTVGENLAGCIALNSTHWVYSWYDDQANDATLSSRQDDGTLVDNHDSDAGIGDNGQTAVAGLRSSRLVQFFYDSTDDEVTFELLELSGGTLTPINGDVDIDSAIGGSTRIAAAEIEANGQSHYVLSWQDTAAGDLKAAVYDIDGNNVTTPFTLTTEENPTFRLMDVAGTYSTLGFGLCNRTFAIGYTNASNITRFQIFNEGGTEADGLCTSDTTPPSVALNSPANDTNFTVDSVTFNWTATDDRALNLNCNVTINSQLRAVDVVTISGTPQTITLPVGEALNEWNVSCSDQDGNSNSSTSRFFSVDVTDYLVDADPGVDVRVAALDNTTLVFAWIDSGDNDASFEIWHTNGTLLIGEIDLDTDIDGESRIAVEPINSSVFTLALFDGPASDDDLDFYLYDRNGLQVQGLTNIDGNIGPSFVDVGVCQLGDRFVVVNADDAGDDADFEIWDNDGTNIVGETAVDGTIAADTSLQNLVDCTALSATRWVYAWYDDQTNDVTVRARTETGADVAVRDSDGEVGETGQSAIAGLRNNRFAHIFYDSADDDITFELLELSGASFTVVNADVDIDTDAGVESRVTTAEVESNGNSNFVVVWQDNASADIKAAVYDQSGAEITAPFTAINNPSLANRLIDVVGTKSLLGFGLCDGTFAIAYTNSSGATTFAPFLMEGQSWDGNCIPDTSAPAITLHAPANNTNFTVSNITFNWTATDDRDPFLECNLTVDDAVLFTTTISPSNTSFSRIVNISDGTHRWNVTCVDNAGNTNTSITRTFTSDVPTGFISQSEGVDVGLAALDNTTLVVAWIDNGDSDASFEIWNTDGTLLVPPTVVDTVVDAESRIAVAPINSSAFTIAIFDGPATDDDLDFYIYDHNGTQIQGLTQIDGNIGPSFADVGVCQLGDRFVVVNADDAGDDADFEIWDNDGTNIVGETPVDGGIGANEILSNLVDCAAINSTRWVYTFFEDAGGGGDDIVGRIVANDGTLIGSNTNFDVNAGGSAQVGAAGLRNQKFAFAYYDTIDENVTMAVYDITGDTFTADYGPAPIDQTAGGQSRVAVAEIEANGESHFVVAWQDNGTGDIKAATYQDDGGQVAAPFTIEANPDDTYLLLDVTGYYSTLGFGLCDGTFAIAYTNSSNALIYKTYYEDGATWDGVCIIDVEAPNVTLNAPANNTNFVISSITFNWTATDNIDTQLSCDLYIDGFLRFSNIPSPNGTPTTQALGIANGNHTWYVNCEDNRGNNVTSETRNFNVNAPSDFNDVDLPDLGDLGVLLYANTSFPGTPIQRNWTGTLSNPETIAPDFGPDISWMKFTCSKVRPECYVLLQPTDNSINFAVYNLLTSSWQNQTVLDATRGLDVQPSFDIACEDDGFSTDCLIAYETSSAANQDFSYRIWNSSGMSVEFIYTVPSAAALDFRWIKLYPQKGANRIAAVVQNDEATRDIHAVIWEGDNNSFIDEQNLTTNGVGTHRRLFDCAWEGGSGDLLCMYSPDVDDLFAYEYDVSDRNWIDRGNIYDALGAEAWEITLCGEEPFTEDFTHDVIGVITCDQDRDRDGGVWTGSAFSKSATGDVPAHDSSSECGGNDGNDELRSESCRFERSGDQIIFVWTDINTDYPEGGTYTVSTSSFDFTSWGAGMPIGSDGAADIDHIITAPSPGNDEIFILDQDGGDDLSCALWTGRSFDATQCGDFEFDGPTSEGGYISFDWLRFPIEPNIFITDPINDSRLYTYLSTTNPSIRNIAYDGAAVTLPPASAVAPITGTEAATSEYGQLNSSNNARFTTTLTSTTGERAYHSFKFEVGQSVNDINMMVILHEGYATGTTFQTPDNFFIYIYNHTGDVYQELRNVTAHSTDMVTEATLTEDFNDYIVDGDLYLLIEGDHATGVAADARADLYTDYIEVAIASRPNIRGNQTINVTAIDSNGVDSCTYAYYNTTGQVTNRTGLNQTSITTFVNISDTTTFNNALYNITAFCNDTFTVERNATVNVRIDNIAPSITLISPNESATFVTSNITFVWNGTDNANGRLNCTLFLDAAAQGTDIGLDSGGQTNFTVTGISDGSHNWSVTCYDVAGNSVSSETRNFSLDTGGPTINLTYPPNSFNSSNPNITFNYTPFDAVGIANCSLFINDILNQTNTSITNNQTNQFFLNNMNDGHYNWSVNCTDTFGFSTLSEVRNLTIDTQPPTVVLNTPSGINFTNGTASLNFTATDNLDTTLICNITVNGVVEDANISAPNGTLVNRSLTLPDGFKLWNVTCVDDAGNTQTSETRNFTLAGPPFIVLNTPANQSVSNGALVIFNYSVQDGDGVANCSLIFDGAVNQTRNGSDITNPGNNTFNLTSIPAGIHNWTVNCTDSGGQEGTAAPYLLIIDLTPPNINLNYPPSGEVFKTSLITFNFTAIDHYSSTMTCNITIDGVVDPSNQNFAAANNTVTSRNQTLQNGLHFWNVTCRDEVYNFNTSLTRNFTVNETFPINVTVTSDKPLYQSGEVANVSITTANSTGSPVNATIVYDIIYTNTTNTSVPWWNISWLRRAPITITETTGTARQDELVQVNLTSLNSAITSCSNEIRVISYQDTLHTEVTRNVTDGDDATYCTFTFAVNLTASESSANTYFVYFNNSAATAPGGSVGPTGLRVQRDTIVAAGTTLSAALPTPVNASRAFVLYSANTGNSAPDQWQFSSNLTATNVSFDRYDGATSSDLSWQVIEHPTDLSVQRGLLSFNSTENVTNTTIQIVNRSRAFIIVHGRTASGSASLSNTGFFRGRFLDNQTIELQRTTTGAAASASWQVVEWQRTSVEEKSISFTSTSDVQTISQVNTSRAFLIFSYGVNGDDSLDTNHIRGRISGTTSVTFSRQSSSPASTVSLNYFVVSLPEGMSVQDGTTSFSADTNQPVTQVLLNKTFHHQTWQSSGGGTTYMNAMVRTNFTNTTNLLFDKETASNTQTLDWFVIEEALISQATTSAGLTHLHLQRLTNATGIDGNFSFLYNTSNRTLGNYSVVARATNSSHDPGVGSNYFTIEQDDEGPIIILLDPANNTGLLPPASVTFSYNVSDIGNNVANCSLLINGAVNQTNTTISEIATNNFTLTNMPENQYNWSVLCYDTLGNNATSEERILYVDATGPNVTALSPNGTAILNNTVVFNFTVVDNLADILLCNVSVDEGNYSTLVNATSGANTSTSISSIADGFHLWNVTCTDYSGNSGTSNTLNFTVDAAPIVTLDIPADGFGTTAENITLFYYVTESTLANCSLLLNGTVNQTVNASAIPFHDSSDVNNFTLLNLSEGRYLWNVQCIDTNGFVGNATEREFQVDTGNPNVTLNSPADNATFFTSSITFNFTAFDNVDNILTCNLTINDVVNTTNINASNGVPTTTAVTGFVAGNYTWNVTCQDNTGFSNTSETRFFNVSSEVNIVLNSPSNNSIDGDGNLTLTYTPSSIAGFESGGFCLLFFDGGLNQTDSSVTNGAQNSFNLTNVAEGVHNWYINCTDDNINTGISESRTLTVDLTNPAVTAHSPDGATFNTSSILFNWTATDNIDTSLTCNVTVNGTIQSPNNIASLNNTVTNQTYSGFSDGMSFWNVTCQDDGGHSATSLTLNFTVQEAPSITLNTPADGFRDNITSITLVYTPSDNSGQISNCTLYINGTANQTNTSITEGAQNNFSLTGLNHTMLNWTVECTDPSGNKANATETRIFYIDFLGPSIVLNFPQNDTAQNSNNITFNWTPTDHPGTTINCSIFVTDPFGNRSQSGITGTSGTDFTNLQTNLSDGPHTWNVTCVDDLGNSNSSLIYVFVINQPDLVLTSGNISFNDTNPDPNENITISADITNIGGNPATNLLVEFWDGERGIGTLIGNATLNVGINVTATVNTSWLIPLGFHSVHVYADPANAIGELNESNNNASLNISTLVSTINSPANGTIFNTSTFTLNFTVADYVGGTVNYSLFIDGSLNSSGTATDNVSQLLNLTLSEGRHELIVEATDDLGRSKNSTTVVIFIDTSPPVITFVTANNTFFNSTTATIQFIATDGTSQNISYTVFLDGSSNQSNTTLNGTTTNVTFIGLSEGQHTVVIEATDEVGNTGNSTTLTIVVDLTPPTPVILTANQTWFSDTTPAISFNITDNLDTVLNYTFYVDGSDNVNGSVANSTLGSQDLATLAEGAHNITLMAYDDAGNKQNSTTIVIYVDVTLPTIDLHNPLPNESLLSQNATFNFTVTDNLDPVLACNLTVSGYGITAVNATSAVSEIVNLTSLSFGIHYWNVTCIDEAGNTNTSETRNFTIPAPDLVITSGNITFSNSSPIEGQNITINATIFNTGLSTALNVTTQFYLGDPDDGGTQINGNFTTALLAPGANATFTVNFTAVIGNNDIYVVVDPPFPTNGSITEENETNNKAFNTFQVGLYNIFSGTTANILQVADTAYTPLWKWNFSNATGGNILIADTDSTLDFFSLQAIGRNTSNETSFDDFADIDAQLNSTNYTDSVNITWLSGGTPIATRNYDLFGNLVVNVSIVNSTNTSAFQTGILWDTSDGGTEYNGSQDLIFITLINESKTGSRGTYDYEARVPAPLRDIVGATATVTFYVELL